MPVQASCRPTNRAIIAVTWPSISAEMRWMSADAAWMRSVSTWNCVAMLPLLIVSTAVGGRLVRG